MPSTNYQNQTIFVGLVCIESTTAVKKKKRKKTMRRNHRNMKKQYQFTFLLSKESRVYHYWSADSIFTCWTLQGLAIWMRNLGARLVKLLNHFPVLCKPETEFSQRISIANLRKKRQFIYIYKYGQNSENVPAWLPQSAAAWLFKGELVFGSAFSNIHRLY